MSGIPPPSALCVMCITPRLMELWATLFDWRFSHPSGIRRTLLPCRQSGAGIHKDANLWSRVEHGNEYGAPYNTLSQEVRAAAAELAALKFEVLQKVGEAVGKRYSIKCNTELAYDIWFLMPTGLKVYTKDMLYMVSEKPGSMFGIIQRLAWKMWLQIRRMPC